MNGMNPHVVAAVVIACVALGFAIAAFCVGVVALSMLVR